MGMVSVYWNESMTMKLTTENSASYSGIPAYTGKDRVRGYLEAVNQHHAVRNTGGAHAQSG